MYVMIDVEMWITVASHSSQLLTRYYVRTRTYQKNNWIYNWENTEEGSCAEQITNLKFILSDL